MFWPFQRDVWTRIRSKLRKERDQNEKILEQLKQANRIFATALSLEGTFGRSTVFKDDRRANHWPVGGWFILKRYSDITRFQSLMHEIFVILNVILQEAERITFLSGQVVRALGKAKYGNEKERILSDVLAPDEMEVISYCRRIEERIQSILDLLNAIIHKGGWSSHHDVHMNPFETYWSTGDTNNWIISLRQKLPILESNFSQLLQLLKKATDETKR